MISKEIRYVTFWYINDRQSDQTLIYTLGENSLISTSVLISRFIGDKLYLRVKIYLSL